MGPKLSKINQPECRGARSCSAPQALPIAELKLQVPGRFVLVDHALSRAERGLAGYLMVGGEPNPEIFNAPEDEA